MVNDGGNVSFPNLGQCYKCTGFHIQADFVMSEVKGIKITNREGLEKNLTEICSPWQVGKVDSKSARYYVSDEDILVVKEVDLETGETKTLEAFFIPGMGDDAC